MLLWTDSPIAVLVAQLVHQQGRHQVQNTRCLILDTSGSAVSHITALITDNDSDIQRHLISICKCFLLIMTLMTFHILSLTWLGVKTLTSEFSFDFCQHHGIMQF